MPPGVELEGVQGGWEGQQKIPEFNQIWCVSYSHEWHMQWHNFFGPRPLGPWGGAKRSNIIKFQLLSQFQIFLNQTLCVFSQMKDTKHFRRDFHSVAWVMPRGQNFNFLNMIMWHIKLKGMISRPGYNENFYPMIKLVTLGQGQKVKYH